MVNTLTTTEEPAPELIDGELLQTPGSDDAQTLQVRSNAVEAMHNRRFRIAGDVVARATSDLPPEQKATARWFANYCAQTNSGPEEIARMLPKRGKPDEFYSWHSVYTVLTGVRNAAGAGSSLVIDAMAEFRRKIEGQVRLGSSGFIETRVAKAMWDRCDKARKRHRIAFIVGDSQIGKTTNLRRYQELNNHGQTIFIDTMDDGSKGSLLGAMDEVCNVPQVGRVADHGQRLGDCFDPSMQLIVDNAHRMLRSKRGVAALTFLLWLYDRRGCSLALSMTHEGYGSILRGPHAKLLQQLWRRRVAPLILPPRMPDDDLALFAQSYGLEAASKEPVTIRVDYYDEGGKMRQKNITKVPLDLQAEVVTTEGLGMWLETLEEARDQATLHGRPISWAAVLKAHCVIQADSEVML